MSAVYDNWERLVAATLKRELLRQLALINSSDSSSFSSTDSDLSFNFPTHDVSVCEASVIPSSSSYSAASSSQYHHPSAVAIKELRKATKSFRYDLLLGGGRFGYVFKGWFDEKSVCGVRPGYGTVVAVKKWYHGGSGGNRGYLTEILISSLLHHPNLVKIIAYCTEENHRLSVYEFMPNGSLENHLFNGTKNGALSWGTRINVAKGVARGLSFLHDMEPQVIHRDVKASNILLDGEFGAKLSGFASAKLSSTGSRTSIHTRVKGTDGYIAPEYIVTGELTAKCDVFSFGVVLLELLCGRRAVDTRKSSTKRYLVQWAFAYLLDKRRLFQIMDTKLDGQYPQEDANAVADLSLRCLSPDPKLRPSMKKVLAALEHLK